MPLHEDFFSVLCEYLEQNKIPVSQLSILGMFVTKLILSRSGSEPRGPKLPSQHEGWEMGDWGQINSSFTKVQQSK